MVKSFFNRIWKVSLKKRPPLQADNSYRLISYKTKIDNSVNFKISFQKLEYTYREMLKIELSNDFYYSAFGNVE